MTKILAINGSYREDGITDQTIAAMVNTAQAEGAEIEVIRLRDYPIEFCLNCRECTQQTGESPGKCVQHDAMQELVSKIEQADAYIFASPTNFGSVTAIFKRFMERLVVYAYWPWDMNTPKFRKANTQKKKAVIVSSCAAPGIFGRFLYSTQAQLKYTAKTVGAVAVGSIFTGLIATEKHPNISTRILNKAKVQTLKLI